MAGGPRSETATFGCNVNTIGQLLRILQQSGVYANGFTWRSQLAQS